MAFTEDFDKKTAVPEDSSYKIWKPCGCPNCFLKGQYVEDGWLCEYHANSPRTQWFDTTRKMEQWRPMISLAAKLAGDFGSMYNLYGGIGSDAEKNLNQMFADAGCPNFQTRQDLRGFNKYGQVIPRPETAYELRNRLKAYLRFKILGVTHVKPVALPKQDEKTNREFFEEMDSLKREFRSFKPAHFEPTVTLGY